MQSITLGDIESQHHGQMVGFGFLPKIETLYRCENVADQAKTVAINLLIGCFLYDTFLLSDYIVSGADFKIYVIGRLGLVTPLCLWLIYLISRRNTKYQLLMSIVPCFMNMVQSVLIIMGSGSYRINYLFGEILVCICAYVITRPRIRFVAVSVGLQALCYLATLHLADGVGESARVVGTLYCLSGCLITIMAAFALEQASRRAFLLGLRVRLLNQELERIAMTDALTGLGNRRQLDDATRRFWGTPAAVGVGLASMILIDVDRFKSFNDNYGHSAGDVCLTTIARCVAARMRPGGDLAVRFGGEEIIAFLPDTDFAEARRIAEIIRLDIVEAAVAHPALAPDAVVTASLGVATAPTAACTAAELVIRADMALYAAKHGGRNQVWPPVGPNRTDTPRHAAALARAS